MIYLDSAATTLQKPDTVARAVAQAVHTMTTPGRGGYRPAQRAADTAFACRMAAAELFDMPEHPERVIFTSNATHALNLAIKTLMHPGDRVVISGYEHNAVTRPLVALGAETLVAQAPLFRPEVLLRQMEEAITDRTAAVVCTHVSNVFGYVLPVHEIAAICRERGVPFVLDASQSAGVIPISCKELGADFVAMPGHKGLYGPQGTGLLLCAREDVNTLLEGGTGSASALPGMPEVLPDRLEAGTHNMPGIAGLLEGLRFVKRTGIGRIRAHEERMIRTAVQLLRGMDGVTLYASPDPGLQTGVLSLCMEGMECEQVGEVLGKRGVAVRAGLHCAPLAHRTAGTFETGTIRMSVSAFTMESEIRRFAHMLREIRRNGAQAV